MTGRYSSFTSSLTNRVWWKETAAIGHFVSAKPFRYDWTVFQVYRFSHQWCMMKEEWNYRIRDLRQQCPLSLNSIPRLLVLSQSVSADWKINLGHIISGNAVHDIWTVFHVYRSPPPPPPPPTLYDERRQAWTPGLCKLRLRHLDGIPGPSVLSPSVSNDRRRNGARTTSS